MHKTSQRTIIFLFILFLILPFAARASSGLAKRLSGKILLNAQGNGEAWYVNPANNKRYFLGRPNDAFRIMRELALGISNAKLALIEPATVSGPKIASSPSSVGDQNQATDSAKDLINIATSTIPKFASSTIEYDRNLANSLSGKILLQVEGNGESWYINPSDLKRYYLGRPADAFRIMRELSLGISRQDLMLIHKPGNKESINQFSGYEHRLATTTEGNFSIDLVEIDLTNPKLKIITDTADPHPAPDRDKNRSDYGAKSMAQFVVDNNAIAGINGSYFCSNEGCSNRNYYFYPILNSRTGELINESELKYWTTGPIFAFDVNNKFYYFKDSREFKGKKDFESKYGVKLQAAIGNKPRLIQDYMNYLIDWELDQKQTKSKVVRNAIGYKNNKVYLVVAYGVTMENLGAIMQENLGVEYALNLDGGYSSALIYNDEYMIGPGRDVPNAILFAEVR